MKIPQVQASRLARRARGALATAIAVAALVLGPAAMASAVATPAPTPSPTSSSPAASPETIQIWVRVAADKSNVAGASVLVTGPKGFHQTFVTGADGKVLVGVPRPGDYKLLLDNKSLPSGKGTPPSASNPRVVTVSSGDVEDPAYFLLVPGGTAPTVPGSTGTPGAGHSSGGSQNTTDYGALVANLTANGLIFGLLLALASIGVSLIYGTTGLSNFAHGELVTFGALTGYVLSGVLHLPGWIGIVGAAIAGGLMGLGQDAGLWKPLRKKGVGLIPLMIVSIGLSLVLRYLYEFIFGSDQLIIPSDSRAAFVLGPIKFTSITLISVILCVVLLLLVAFILLRTRIGKATRAVADNRALAAASGINVERIIRLVWIGSGVLAALAGVLIGYYQTLRWDTGGSILLLVFAAVTLGGFGTAFGALVGSLVIGLVVNLSTLVIPANVQNAAALLIMIIILLVRPQGILGRRERIG